ncbi:Ger(x)C family spore germination protein [Salinithrix halophila]|uniref:Ger(X)C family spore germination protein n=1 Tax=Salinithrix halophila TaxID=1485204 RepID=A0ABV8JCQ6_9BACL
MGMKRLKGLLAIFLCICLLTGCWNRREIDELAIVLAAGIDKTEKGQYRFSLQFVNPSEVAGEATGRSSSVTTYADNGYSLFEALRAASQISPRRLYVGSTQVLVISEEVAKEGIEEIFDLLHRDPEFQTSLKILVARGISAEDLLSTATSLEKVPASKLTRTLQITEKVWAESIANTTHDIVGDLVSEGKDPVISGVRVTGDPGKGRKEPENTKEIIPPAKIKFAGLALFRKDRFKGWADYKQARGILWGRDKIRNPPVSIGCKKEKYKISIETVRSKTRIHTELVHGKPKVRMVIRPVARVTELICLIDLDNPENIHQLEKRYAKVIRNEVKAALRFTQKKKLDVFGFGDAFSRSNNEWWKTVKDKWPSYYSRLDVQVDIVPSIRRTGLRGKPFQAK